MLALLLVNIICGQHGGNNPYSRYSLLRMMSQKATFNIEPIVQQKYRFWTDDWSSTGPDHFYSNKAPGSAFMALPIFLPLDYLSKWTWKKPAQSWMFTPPSRTTRKLTSIILQVVLFIVLFLSLMRRGQLAPFFKNPLAIIIFLVLFGFANTASNYMNTLFGHGLAAVLTFWFANSLLSKRTFQLGLSFGFGLLNDYSFAFFLFPALVFLIYQHRTQIKNYLPFALGGMPPGILWVWYHWICFGSPLTIANKFQNPKYVDVQSGENLWGIFSTKLNFNIYYELLFGPKRGILVTQPWILIAFLIILVATFNKKIKAEYRLFFASNLFIFILLLVMNASFGGWHGGSTIGPRYLSIVFPWFAMSIACLVQEGLLDSFWKWPLAISTAWSVWFFNLVNATYILSFSPDLVSELTQVFIDGNTPKSVMRTLSTIGLLTLAIIIEKKKITEAALKNEVPHQQEKSPQ